MARARTKVPTATITAPGHVSRDELIERGRAERKRIPRRSHGEWTAPTDRRDPLEILAESNASRVPELVPVRYGRMVASPFAYFRGAPAVMAHDLARGPRTDLWPQICGDAHLSNFGLFASPERAQVFDINDFDETLPGPFEWDLKRLAASIVVAAREHGHGDGVGRRAVDGAVRSYATAMAELARLTSLDVWYTRVDSNMLMENVGDSAARRRLDRNLAKSRANTNLRAFDRLTQLIDGRRVIVEQPPLLVHLDDLEDGVVSRFWERYLASLPVERRHLLDQYRYVDAARKVVGVGSVGTRCFVVLLEGRAAADPLFMQIKEAQASVLEPHLGRSALSAPGERVVVGQRLMQAVGDIMLGWVAATEVARSFFVRQFRDMKFSADLTAMPTGTFEPYARLCGGTLARAHARTLDPGLLSGYIGGGATLGEALVEFATSYARQNAADHAQLVAAVADGAVEAVLGA